MIVTRADGSLLVSGAMPADALAEHLKIELPETREFATAGGYVLAVLKQVPREGLSFEDQGWTFEVVDMGRIEDRQAAGQPQAWRRGRPSGSAHGLTIVRR